MSKGVSYALGAVVLLVLIGAGAYAYTTAPTKAPSALVNEGAVMTAPAADGKFQIVSERSTASFSLEEDLRGTHITVLGTTNQVSGAVKADPASLAATEFDTIRINARTFVTDSEQRNNAIRRMILKTENDANEFIEFKPKSVSGTPATIEIGQPFSFKTTGDLTVSGVTKEVTFDGTATFDSADEISGSAQTRVHYPDFGVTVPDLPFLANVDQDTTLKIDFVAKKSS